MVTAAFTFVAIIAYLTIGAFIMNAILNAMESHEERDACDNSCWCGQFIGGVLRVVGWTGVLTWLPILGLFWIPLIHEFVRILWLKLARDANN